MWAPTCACHCNTGLQLHCILMLREDCLLMRLPHTHTHLACRYAGKEAHAVMKVIACSTCVCLYFSPRHDFTSKSKTKRRHTAAQRVERDELLVEDALGFIAMIAFKRSRTSGPSPAPSPRNTGEGQALIISAVYSKSSFAASRKSV